MRRLYVGVDGGGTHARAAVIDDDGRELARRTGPAGLVDPREPSGAATVVAQLARDALHDAGADMATALCCGLAGAGRPQEREAVRVALTLEHVAERVVVVGDAEAAMADAFPDGSGVLVVAGTGSIAWARASDRVPIRVGGWGRILGDEGSAYDIAMAGLRTVARAHDGRLPRTTLTDALITTLRMHSPDDLIAWAAAASKAEIAALAPIVLSCAGQGDRAAAAILEHAVRSIVLLAVTAASRAGLESPEIALMGGLIARSGPLRGAVADALRRELPGCTIIDRTVDAVLGAARLARAL